jgi:predicted AlkP superfamily phosphohydrolase/phosphomutase
VRINLRGREAAGIVRADDYDAECARVTEFLRRARHGRTGRPLIREVLRTRRSADDDDPRHPHADLVVVFEEDPVDVVDSPDVGRIGPVPFYRTGGHTARGFAIATGPAIAPGGRLPDCEVVDLAPTILEMLGAPVPGHYDGRSWLAAAKGSRRADAS